MRRSTGIDFLSAPGMATNFDALARSYDHVVVDAGEAAGPEIERIAEIAPHAVLVTDTLANAATASARRAPAGLGLYRRDGYSSARLRQPGETAAAA